MIAPGPLFPELRAVFRPNDVAVSGDGLADERFGRVAGERLAAVAHELDRPRAVTGAAVGHARQVAHERAQRSLALPDDRLRTLLCGHVLDEAEEVSPPTVEVAPLAEVDARVERASVLAACATIADPPVVRRLGRGLHELVARRGILVERPRETGAVDDLDHREGVAEDRRLGRVRVHQPAVPGRLEDADRRVLDHRAIARFTLVECLLDRPFARSGP